MPSERPYIGTYWGDRQESAAEGGTRLAACLGALAGIEPLLGAWFRTGMTRATANIPVSRDVSALTDLLYEGRKRGDLDNGVIEDLGFSVGLWNGAPAEVGLSAHVGSYANHPGILNNFLLRLPKPDETSAHLYRPDVGVEIIEAIVEAWQPDWATWSSPPLRGSQKPSREPEIGWLTYLRDTELGNEFADLSQQISGGVLLKLAPSFSETTPEQVADLHQRLARASLLHPIP